MFDFIQYKFNGARKREFFRTREVLDDRDPQAVAVVVETPMQKKERKKRRSCEFPRMKNRSVCQDRLVTQTEENNVHPQAVRLLGCFRRTGARSSGACAAS
jgi:hypothetical protein